MTNKTGGTPKDVWSAEIHEQALDRLKRPELKLSGVTIEFNSLPKVIGKCSEFKPVILGHDATFGRAMSTAISRDSKVNVAILDRPQEPMGFRDKSASIRGSFDVLFEEHKPIGSIFNRWVDMVNPIEQKDVPPIGTDIDIYSVPWQEDCPEGYYLMKNDAFSKGAKLPRGKCTRKYGGKPITKMLFKDCHLHNNVDTASGGDPELAIEMTYGSSDASQTIFSK